MYIVLRYVDYLLLMAYNYHGSWNDFTGHHSALFPRGDETGQRLLFSYELKSYDFSTSASFYNTLSTYWIGLAVPNSPNNWAVEMKIKTDDSIYFLDKLIKIYYMKL